jgi:cGMP-dependent protein kinase 2
VLTLDQLEGLKDPSLPCWTNEADCDGDPPRLWSPAGLFPGTAFTRSLGDSAAEDIGVIADPEMSVTQLGPQHRAVIVATDGVWEFISSQKAVDMVSAGGGGGAAGAAGARFRRARACTAPQLPAARPLPPPVPPPPQVLKHDDPYDAAKALTAQAYKLWLQKETRTDDISAVIIFLDWAAPAGAAEGAALPLQATPPQGDEPPSRLGALWRTRSGKAAPAAPHP